MAPPMERIMPISGPAMACISSGSTSPMAAPTRSATGSTSSFHTGRVASTHSARLHATAEPAPDGSDVASSSHRSARRTASSTAVALGGADARVLGAVRRALGDRLAGDLLGHVPVHRAALVGEHLAELLEGGAQVVRVQRAEHRGERIVRAARAAEADRAARRSRTGWPGPDHHRSAGPSSCPRRRPPAPPAEGRIRMGCHSRDSSARKAAGSVPTATARQHHPA